MFINNGSFRPFDKKVYLSSPTMHGEELEYMKYAYDTNWMSTIGENINVLEKDIPAYIGVKCGVCLASGTAALHMAVKLLGLGRGDKVLCSDMTFAATVNPVSYEGAEQVFVDTDPADWNMDPEALERAFELHPDAKAVIVVNLYGVPAKLQRIVEIAHSHGVPVIEDAAESLGATLDGRQTGSFGDIAIISFNGNKIITGSSGGMLLCNDGEMAAKVRKWSTQSRDAAPWYQHTELGYNYRMSNVIAGVVRGQLPHLSEHVDAKRRIYERYKAGLAGLPVSMNPIPEGCEPNYWLSCLIIDEDAMCKCQRSDGDFSFTPESGKSCPDEILGAIASIGAEGRPIWKPMHKQPIFSHLDFVTKDGVDRGSDIFARGLCLPSDNKMTEEEQDEIIRVIRACFQ